MTTHFTEVAMRAAQDGSVSPAELLELRRTGWSDGVIRRDEAEALFAVNNVLEVRDAEWSDFFVEAITEHVLNGTEPKRQCSPAEANWLIAQIDHDGVVDSLVELETMVRVLEKAENTPITLKNYVLQQVEREVLTGVGPTRCGGELSATHISAAECRILRRVIFAAGGHGPVSASQYDAELLFRLKDATLEDENAPEWEKLFLDGVANYLKGFVLPNAQLSHARKSELESFIADNESNVGRFMGRAVREAPKAFNHLGKVFGKRGAGGAMSEDAAKRINAAAAAGAELTSVEESWLKGMVEADGQLDDLERQLMRRLAEED